MILPQSLRVGMSDYLVRQGEAAANIQARTGCEMVGGGGDVRYGSVKRVASAVGEGSIAIQLPHQYFAAEQLSPQGGTSDATPAVA